MWKILKNISILVILSAFLALLHFLTVAVVVILIVFHDFAPQGADAVTESQRIQRERWKPFEDAFMTGLEVSFKVLSFPLAMGCSPLYCTWRWLGINSLFWGLVMRMTIRVWLSKEKKNLHFKPVGNIPIYSVRIGYAWRALRLWKGDTITWFWIGSHEQYFGQFGQTHKKIYILKSDILVVSGRDSSIVTKRRKFRTGFNQTEV